jgi:euchromatic histone-lysine N-methyltransferase
LCESAEAEFLFGCRLLLDYGADVNMLGWTNSNALARAAKEGHAAIAKHLLERGANPKAHSAGGCWDPLVCAAQSMSIEMVRLLLSHGADAARTDDGVNVLHGALQRTTAEICAELLAHGADARAHGGTYDETPMHVVARYSFHSDGPERVKILDLLVRHGATVLVKDNKGKTPGQIAVERGDASAEVLHWFAEHKL